MPLSPLEKPRLIVLLCHQPGSSCQNANTQNSLRALIDEYNIHFQSADDGLPPNLQREYDVVQEIDNASFEGNSRRSAQKTLSRTSELLEAVRWCAKIENNEDTWRREVETTIFATLAKHHACPKCGNRLWRAGVEFPIGDEAVEQWENLRKRRDRRDKDPRPKDRVFQGLSGRHVQYEPDLAKRAPTGIFPDLIVGLANSTKFMKVLRSPSGNGDGKRVGDEIKSDLSARR
ncbi:hypothetical protein BDW74DRAFT_182013 [Aspergillus multicolor]|uniref:uncharacterized protein n=1 Tax=Aspergillus multicolor TaxID=41759 RepID=UPI003CCDFF25